MSFMAAPLLAFALALPTHAADATAPTTCKDGTTSNATGKGACSGHGGVMKAASTSTTTAAPTPAAAPAAPAPKGGPDQLQGRHDFVCYRQRGLQRTRGRAKSDSHHVGSPACRGGSGACSCTRSDYDRGKVDSGCHEVGTDGHGRQHRPDRCDRQVQGRNLLQIAAPQWDLLEPRRGRRMVDCRSVATRRMVSRQLVSHGS